MLLVLTQIRKTIMKAYELNSDLISESTEKKSGVFLDKDKILCNHCKRTSSNGIRCMGICVADNNY